MRVADPPTIWLVVGSRDRYEIDGGTDWDRAGANRCDVNIREFVATSCPCSVRGLHADGLGTLRIDIAPEYVLEVFPDASTDDEQWRFFSPYDSSAHAVFSGGELRDE